MATIPKLNVGYGLTNALLNVFPSPLVALRDPQSTDKAQMGTIWVNKAGNNAFVLTSVVNNAASWVGLAGAGTFNSLDVTGTTNLTGTTNMVGTTNINSAGAGPTFIATGTGTLTMGNATAPVLIDGQLSVADKIFSGEDVDILQGGIIIRNAGEGIQFPGPINMVTGAGAPDNGLAVNVGDIYINTTAATAETRMYIATGAGAWTNFTCAA